MIIMHTDQGGASRTRVRAALLLLAAACGDSTSGTGGAGAGMSSGGQGGAGGALVSGGAPAGGAGGAASTCSPYAPESCEEGLACVVADDALGLDGGTECAAPGAGVTYSACSSDGDCAAGTLCDRVTSTCKPFCETAADCVDGGACVSARSSAGAEIPGLKLCLAACDPVSSSPCGSAGPGVGCLYRADEEAFDCALAGDAAEGQACTEQAECGVDLGCLEVNDSSGCLHWCVYDGGTDICTSQEHPTSQFAICVPQSPTISVDGVVYGGCLPQL